MGGGERGRAVDTSCQPVCMQLSDGIAETFMQNAYDESGIALTRWFHRENSNPGTWSEGVGADREVGVDRPGGWRGWETRFDRPRRWE